MSDPAVEPLTTSLVRDPEPLHYQFAAEHAGEFSWDYLEHGPIV